MNEQELFNKAYIGLDGQGFKRSFDIDKGRCMYRGPDGRKCAIGHAIPDELYDPIMEEGMPGSGFGILLGLMGFAVFGDFERHEFANNLQSAHDCADCPEDMKHRLQNFAKNYGLTIPKTER